MKLKLVQKIALLPILTAVVLLALMLFSNYYGQSDTLEQSEGKRIATAANIFWQEVDRDALANEELLTILTADDRLVDKMLSGDREGFLAMAKPIFSELKRKYDITHFYAIDKTGKVFLRVHNPPSYGDQLKRATYLKASSTGEVGKGIEMGKKFYSLRVVMPIKRNGEVVGYFELGEELFHLVKGFTANSTASISMWITDAYAQQYKISEVFKAVGNWHLVMASDESQQDSFMQRMGPQLKESMDVSTHLQYEGQDWFVRTFPFKDAFGKTAGVIAVGTDTSAMHSRITKFMGTVLIFAIIVLVVMVVGSLWMSRAVTRPLSQVNDMLKDISAGEGDLTRRLTITSKDEVGEVAANFNAFVEKIQGTISQVKQTLVQLVDGVRGMSDVILGANDLMTRQRQETDMVASSINEMSATIQDVARNANDAAIKAREADESASEGQNVVNQTVTAIQNLAGEIEASTGVVEELSKESENIGAVLVVIKNIAEQTNLLALNAAIEAARAGEQGRGFAVVADEVRTLAQRTQESTHEIETMIQSLQQRTTNAVGAMSGSRDHVHKSVDMAGQASVALSTISQAVAAISSMNTQTATATEEQTSVANEVDRNITNIRQVTEEVSNNAENSMASSQQLVALCDNIEFLVDQFKV